MTNARGVTVTSSYDARQLRTGIDYGDTTPDVTYTHDDAGRLKTVSDGTGTRSFTYDDNDKLTGVTLPGASDPSFVYTYDNAGNLKTRQLPDGQITGYDYDLDDRLTTQTTGTAVTTYGYDAAANLTTTQLPAGNAAVETRGYDRAGRLTAIGSKTSAGAVLNNFGLTLDPAGRPTKVLSARAGLPEQTRLFGYNEVGRLTTECVDPSAEADCQGGTLTTYDYDKVGNRRTTVVRGGATTTSTYTDADQLKTATTGTTGTSFEYDDDGNRTAAGSDTFGYDAENRQTRAGAFSYDDTGNRITTRKAGDVVRTSTWDINNPLPLLATDTDSAGAVTSYLSNPLGQPLTQLTATGTFSLLHDWLGSVTDVTDAAGVQQRRTSYDAYGIAATTALSTTAPADRFGFTGALNDPDLAGTLRFPARSYTPATGTWDSRDPAQYPPTKPYTSTYGYAEQSPTFYTDPSGRCAMICTAIAGGIIGGLVGGGCTPGSTATTRTSTGAAWPRPAGRAR